jgi:hypothetical protein
MSSNGSPVPSVGRFEAAHGNAKAVGTELVFQAVPDGVRDAAALPAVPHPSPNGKPFTSDTARSAAQRRWELAKAPDFARQELDFVPTETFGPFDEARREKLKSKLDEALATFRVPPTGGATTVARGWAWLVSFGEFYATRAATTGSDDDAERSRRFFKDASIELAKFHEIMRAESAAHPKETPQERIARQVRAMNAKGQP